jgi:hypothetical protein
MTWPKYTTYIDVTDGLYVGTNHPIDPRFTVETYNDLADIVTYAKAYEGLRAYVEDEDTFYTYSNSLWEREVTEVAVLPDETLDYPTGKMVIYESTAFATDNVAYICVGGASGARVWKAITA